MKLFLRKIYYFPLQPWFVKVVSYFIFSGVKDQNNPDPYKAKNILIVKVDEIGDFVLVTPFLRELRNNYPNSKISLLVKEEAYNLAELCPYVDKVISINLKMNKFFRSFQQYYRYFTIGRNYFWKENFDLCIIPRWDGDDFYSAFFAVLGRAKYIVGYNQKNGTEKLINLNLKKEKIQHEVEQNLDILRALNAKINSKELEIWLSKEDEEYARRELDSCENKTLIGLAPGASEAKRIYPTDSLILLIKTIKDNFGDEIVFLILGTDEDKRFSEKINQSFNEGIINFTGKTTLRQAAALIKSCKIFIGNDSGLIHLASAVKIPVISIHCHPKDGSELSGNSPVRFGPWNEDRTILQPENPVYPCEEYCESEYAHCITEISVNRIYQAMKKWLVN